VKRRRLVVTSVLAVLLAIVIAPLTAMLDRAERGRESDRRNALVSYGAVDLVAAARTVNGELDLKGFKTVQARPGLPSSMFVDPKGALIEGDVPMTKAFRKAAVRQAWAVRNHPARIGRYLVVTEGIASATKLDDLLAVAVSFLDLTTLEREARSEARQRWGLAVSAWILLTGLGSVLLLRTVRRPLQAAEAERTFFADAAHELKTPWAMVRARVDLAREGGPGIGAHLDALTTTAREATHTVDEMLLLARLDAGAPLSRERLRLDALVSTCVSDAEAANPGVTFAAGALATVTVVGDDALLAHAIRNLFENAARHGAPPVEYTLDRRGGRAVLSVIDHGRGVPPSQRDAIFQRFGRGSSRSGGGNGLGLSIARAVAEAHGGSVELQSPPHGEAGSCFVLELPAA
jgi:two-component system, OmpR family, sensor kinase